MIRNRLGQVLLDAALITEDQLEEALESRMSGPDGRERVGQTLVRLGFATEATVAECLSIQLGLEFVGDQDLRPDPETAALLPPALARRHGMLPVGLDEDGALVVACADPTDVVARDDVRTATGARRVRPVVAPETAVDAAIRRVYGFDEEAGDLIGALDEDDDGESPEDVAAAVRVTDGPMIRLVDGIIADAVEARASDIHVEPGDAGTAIRYRIDGVLQESMRVPRRTTGQLLARLKLVAGMDIAERRLPQDGRARFAAHGEEVDLRVSSLPSMHGETIVVRILRKGAERLGLGDVGLDDEQRMRFAAAIERPQGLVLITGPTGSGKTSTLYAGLRHLTDETRNIVTLEDPVEYELERVNQTQIAERIGRTFARCLRTVLRQDPDVVMVGEIRDRETAELALQASMTGHLVLSTLHTNDAPSAVVRLRDLGIPPYLIAGSLTLVVAQRLVRTLCQACVVDTLPTERQITQLHLSSREVGGARFRAGAGCTRCGHAGYRGRTGLFEVLPVDGRIRDLVVAGAPTSEVRRAARGAGMRTLREEGLALATAGVTTLEELLRVTHSDTPSEDGACPACGHGVQPAWAHCPLCGAQLGLPTCTACEHTLEAGWRVCPACGTRAAPRAHVAGVPRVLVVDDDPHVRTAVVAMLADAYDVVEAADGREAVAQTLALRPQVVLLDVGLPDTDGYAVTRDLRSRPQTMDVPIVLFTGADDTGSELRSLRAGADDYLTKPIDPEVLRARLDAVRRRLAG